MGFSHGPAKRRLGLSFTRLSLYKRRRTRPREPSFTAEGAP